jgi:hypothetical protein
MKSYLALFLVIPACHTGPIHSSHTIASRTLTVSIEDDAQCYIKGNGDNPDLAWTMADNADLSLCNALYKDIGLPEPTSH